MIEEGAVGLVDEDQIGQFDDAALQSLQLVAGGRRQDQEEHVDHVGDGRFGLAGADGLDQHRIEPRRLADEDRLARMAGDAAGPLAGRGRADEGRRRARQFGHPRLVAEDGAAAAFRSGIDREHGDAMAARDAVEAEALDEGRFAGAGRAGNADPGGAAGRRQDRLDQRLGRGAMIGAGRFDQRHGAGQRPPLAAPQRSGEFVSRRASRCNLIPRPSRRALRALLRMRIRF